MATIDPRCITVRLPLGNDALAAIEAKRAADAGILALHIDIDRLRLTPLQACLLVINPFCYW